MQGQDEHALWAVFLELFSGAFERANCLLRYNNGTLSASMQATDSLGACGLVLGITQPSNSACTTCHGPSSMLSIEHTPAQTAGYSNEDLIAIFTLGAKPPGGTFNSPLLRAAPMPDSIYRAFHTWEMTDEQKQGLVWKLRSLPPHVQVTQ